MLPAGTAKIRQLREENAKLKRLVGCLDHTMCCEAHWRRVLRKCSAAYYSEDVHSVPRQ